MRNVMIRYGKYMWLVFVCSLVGCAQFQAVPPKSIGETSITTI